MRDNGQYGQLGQFAALFTLLATALIGAQGPAPAAAQAPGTTSAPPPASAAAAATATQILAATREALGGEKRLAAISSFVATGRTRQVSGENLVPIEFEISCELPDKYARRDEIPARESGPTTIGFNGDDLIQLPPPPAPPTAAAPGRAGGPAQLEAARRARTAVVKQDFVRLTLGMFAGSFSGYPLTFTYAGQAEAPQGKADVIDVKAAANFALRFFVYRETHLPIMVSWQTQVQGKPVENRIYYRDYREVDGVRLPFGLRRAVGPDTVEETTFDRFRLNPKIDPRKFEVRK
jgi:hypothetical protein